MPPIDLARIEQIITEVAQIEIMPRFRKLAAGDIEMKGINDPVTIADKAAEAALTARLCEAYPGSVVVGEESFAADPKILSHFSGEKDVWVLDPIDGTRNFIAGTPEFGVMVALVRRKKTVAAWIHDPNSGDTLSAEEGGGVWLHSHKMRLAGHDTLIATVGLTGSKLRKHLINSEVANLLKELPPLAMGSAAAFDYARMFTGDALFAKSRQPRASFLIAYRKAMPWDHLAGLMMLRENNGYSSNWAGQPYDASEPAQGLISTTDKATWDKLHHVLKATLMSGDLP